MSQNATHISQQQAAVELQRRRRARTSLLDFAQYMQPDYAVGEHHRQICTALEAVERGEIDRLMIFAPPRHGKSQLASRHFPAWYLGRNPDKQIITSTYAADFAADFGRDVRNLLRESEYRRLFKTTLSEDSQSAGRWHTADSGIYIATGVGGQLTGRGAHLCLIDDPFKNREDADSETIREKVWHWYTSTLYTRLMPGGRIVLICTRWHSDDLAGRLLEAQDKDGDKWHVISLKAIDDNSSALWPAWYPIESLHRIKAAIGPRDWSALYQQQPQPDEGTFFQRNWFHRYASPQRPEHLNIYITSDYAVTADGGDYTEHAVWGVDALNNLWAIGWWCGQTTADIWIEQLIELIKSYRPLCYFGESGVIRRAIEPILTRRMRETDTYCRMEWIVSTHDKPTRARGFQARASMGKVFIPLSDWGERLIDQLLRFPTGKYDDAVDTCSLMANVIDQAHPAFVPPIEQKIHKDPWKTYEIETDKNWRVT